MITHIETGKLLCFDGLHYSFGILKQYYSNLDETDSLIPGDNGAAIADG
jgi:hypothetical protein